MKKTIGGILMLIGFFIIVGAVGNDDYHTIELGINYPLIDTLKVSALGVVILFTGGWLAKIWEK